MLRLGRKDNDIKHFVDYLPRDVKNIVEPYGGFFAVIRKEYWDDKYDKFVNENDENMCYIYKHPDALFRAAKKINEFINSIKEDKKDMTDFKKKKREMAREIKIFLTYASFHHHLIDYFKRALSHPKNVFIMPYLSDFIKKWKTINFSCKDAVKVIELFSTDPNTFIFIDPPYYNSYNTQYQQTRSVCYNVEDELKAIKKIMISRQTKAKIMLVINSVPFVDELFKDMIITSYEKIYALTKKKDILHVIINFSP